MKIVASGAGQHFRFAPRSPDELVEVLGFLQQLAAEEVSGGGLPPLYASGVRYKRERPGPYEAWNAPIAALADGTGDCEDLAAWRAAELQVSGLDPDASAGLRRAGPRSFHAVVVRGSGEIEDPSAVLGMGAEKRSPLRVRCRRFGSGVYGAQLVAPVGWDNLVARGMGATGADAIGQALDLAVPILADLSTVPARDPEWSVGFGESEAIAAVMPFVEKAIGAAKDWLFGVSYDAFADFANAVAKKDAGVEPGANPAATIAACFTKGIVPVYCSDSPGTMNNLDAAFRTRGIVGKRWKGAYSSGLGDKRDYYGLIYKVSDIPQRLRDQAATRAGSDYDGAMARTIKLCTDAKSHMRTYGGSEDYDALALDLVPILPPAASAPRPLTDALKTSPEVPPGSVPTTPPAVTAPTSDRLAALDRLVDPARADDWRSLQALATIMQREGRGGPFRSMAQALLRMR